MVEAISRSEWAKRRDDPWRLVLPCGHHDFYRRVFGCEKRRRSGAVASRVNVGRHKRLWKGAYTCKQCGERHDHVYDKKAELSIRRAGDPPVRDPNYVEPSKYDHYAHRPKVEMFADYRE